MKKIYDLYLENVKKGNIKPIKITRTNSILDREWTKEEEEQLKIDYANYVPFRVLEYKYGRTRGAIKDKIFIMGLKRKRLKYRKSKLKADKKVLIELYKSGLSSYQVAELLGCTKRYVLFVLEQNKIKRRHVGRNIQKVYLKNEKRKNILFRGIYHE